MRAADFQEEDIEDAFVGGIEALGGMCWKLRMPWLTGVPDRLVLLPSGRVIFVELKKPDGKKATRQKIVHQKLRDLGFRVETLWTFEQVSRFLASLRS